MYAMETDECPRSGYIYLTLAGEPDPEAFAQAVTEVQHLHPSLVCPLQVYKVGLKYLLYRRPPEALPPLQVIDDFAHDMKGLTIAEALITLFEPAYLRRIDLFREAPSRFFLVHFPQGQSALVIHTHHIASDGGTLMTVIRDLFAGYHRRISGHLPEWADWAPVPSSMRTDAPRGSYRRFFAAMRAEAKELNQHPLIRIGNQAPVTSAQRNIVQFTLTEQQTRTAVKKGKAKGGTFNDLLCTTIIQSVDLMLDTPEGTFSLWMPVNARTPKSAGADRANLSTSININLTRHFRADPKRLFESFIQKRKDFMNSGRDFIGLSLLDKLLWVMRHRPLEKRTPRLRKLIHQPLSVMCSNMGIAWPRLSPDGKLTPHTYLTEAGGLEIRSYDMNFSTAASVGHGIVAHTFQGKLTVFLSVYTQSMDLSSAQKLIEFIKDDLTS